jgi:transcriptional regulator with XRE-family HTH domain
VRTVATPREQLAGLLRKSRVDAGYASHGALARKLNVSRPVVTQAENPAHPVPSDAVLAAWAGATGAGLDVLADLAQRARSGPPGWFAKWADDIEARATLIRWFEPLLIPGLLQVESYAVAVLGWKPDSARTEANLRSRLARQLVLDRAELRVLILESVLYREVGDAAVMAEQIQHLLAVGARPSVMLQVVEDTPAVAGALGGAFAIATEGTVDVAAYAESNIQGAVYTDPDLVARAARVFDGLRTDALPWTQTQDLLRKAGERWTP